LQRPGGALQRQENICVRSQRRSDNRWHKPVSDQVQPGLRGSFLRANAFNLLLQDADSDLRDLSTRGCQNKGTSALEYVSGYPGIHCQYAVGVNGIRSAA